MDEATVELAKELKLQEVDEEESFKNGDFAGYYVEGFKDGDRVMLAGVVDLQSRTNFFVVISFDDKDAEAEKEAARLRGQGVALFRMEVAAGMTEAAEQLRQANLDTNVIFFSMWTEAVKNFAEYG
ncbi:MAG: hypothetical protein RLZZ86_3255, partial [Cyanobacteriota bacterium]